MLVSSDCNEFLIFEVAGCNELKHGVPKQVRILAIVEPPCHLLQVGRQMLCRNPMPRANDAALEQRERGLDSVGAHAQAVLIPAIPQQLLRDPPVEESLPDRQLPAGDPHRPAGSRQ